MTHNVRWLLVFLGLGVAAYGLLLLIRPSASGTTGERHAHQRTSILVVLSGVLVAWSSAAWAPFEPWPSVPWGRFFAWAQLPEAPKVLLTCVAYLAIVALSSRGLIGLPQFRLLQARAEELRGLIRTNRSTFADERAREHLLQRIDRAEKAGANRLAGFVFSVPLPCVLRATRVLNSAEKQLLLELSDDELRLAARQIAAGLPESKPGAKLRAEIFTAIDQADDPAIREECVAALTLIHHVRDEPREEEANRIRVAMWLTLVGLAAIYAVSATFPNLNHALITGALGGMLGSLSALILRQPLSLGLIVLSPVAGALNAVGGLLVVAFLAGEELQLLGAMFRGLWESPASTTALTVALLLGFSGGLFSRIAVAGATPLLGSATETTAAETKDAAEEEETSEDATSATNGHKSTVDVNVLLRPRRTEGRSLPTRP